MRFRTSDALHATALVAAYLSGLSAILGGLAQVLPTDPWQLVTIIPFPLAFGVNRLLQWSKRGPVLAKMARVSPWWLAWSYVGAWLAIFGLMSLVLPISFPPGRLNPIAMQGHGALLVALWAVFVCRDTLLCVNGVSTFWWFASWDEIRLESDGSRSKLVLWRLGKPTRWSVSIPDESLAVVRALLSADENRAVAAAGEG